MSRACAKLDEVVAEILRIVDEDKTVSRRADDIVQVGFVRGAAKAKPDILDQLRMFGMTEEGVYPNLQNVCQTLDKRFRNLYPNK